MQSSGKTRNNIYNIGKNSAFTDKLIFQPFSFFLPPARKHSFFFGDQPKTIFFYVSLKELTHSSLAVLTLDVCVVWPFLRF